MHPLYGVLPVLWSYSGILILLGILLAAEPRSRSSTFISFSVHLCGTILLTLYSMVWDRRVSRAGPMLFIGLSCRLPQCLLFYCFLPFSSFFFIAWYCEAGFFGLIGTKSLSPSLALLTFFIITIIVYLYFYYQYGYSPCYTFVHIIYECSSLLVNIRIYRYDHHFFIHFRNISV